MVWNYLKKLLLNLGNILDALFYVLSEYKKYKWQCCKDKIPLKIKRLFYKIAVIEKRYSKVIALIILILGFFRIEIIERSAIKREQLLLQKIEECNTQLVSNQQLKEQILIERKEKEDLILELDSYKIAMIMYLGGKVDTAFIKETIENYE